MEEETNFTVQFRGPGHYNDQKEESRANLEIFKPHPSSYCSKSFSYSMP